MHASARAKALVATRGGHSLTPGKIMSPERHSEMNLKQHPLSTQPSPDPKAKLVFRALAQWYADHAPRHSIFSWTIEHCQ